MTDETKIELVGSEAATAATPPAAEPAKAPVAKAAAKAKAAPKPAAPARKRKRRKSPAASDQARVKAAGFAVRADKQRRRTASADALADYERATAGLVRRFEQLPDDKPLCLRFADGEAFLDGQIDVGRDELSSDKGGGRVVYSKPVVFAPTAEAADVSEVWLLGGKSALRVRLVGKLLTGGGRQAAIPARHLRF